MLQIVPTTHLLVVVEAVDAAAVAAAAAASAPHGRTRTMFCGFRSRWRMRLEWQKSTPLRICLKRNRKHIHSTC